MGSMSLMHWLVVLAIVLVLFGAGKLPRVMGDFAKGIKSFKKGLAEDDKPEVEPPKTDPMKTIDHEAPASATGAPVASGASTETRKAV